MDGYSKYIHQKNRSETPHGIFAKDKAIRVYTLQAFLQRKKHKMNAINLLGLEPQRWIMSSDIPTLSPVDHNSRLMVMFRRWLRLLRLLCLSAHVRHLRTIYKASTPWTRWHGTRHDGKALLR
ncbi:hypothetical protein YC2023_020861 [Brassica napus]